MINTLGYIATAATGLSFLMGDIKKLRLVNAVGCLLWIYYGVMLNSMPIIITNLGILLTHIIFLINELKREKVVGIIAGNFDVMHPGYIEMFNECKRNCDHLIVLLHSDPSIERPEKLKPILSVKERIQILLSLKQVDDVISYDVEAGLHKLIGHLKPDVRFLGDDYKNKPFTGDDLNVRIHFLDRSHGWSTTKYKKMISETVK